MKEEIMGSQSYSFDLHKLKAFCPYQETDKGCIQEPYWVLTLARISFTIGTTKRSACPLRNGHRDLSFEWPKIYL